jgi:hypothetical protein
MCVLSSMATSSTSGYSTTGYSVASAIVASPLPPSCEAKWTSSALMTNE